MAPGVKSTQTRSSKRRVTPKTGTPQALSLPSPRIRYPQIELTIYGLQGSTSKACLRVARKVTQEAAMTCDLDSSHLSVTSGQPNRKAEPSFIDNQARVRLTAQAWTAETSCMVRFGHLKKLLSALVAAGVEAYWSSAKVGHDRRTTLVAIFTQLKSDLVFPGIDDMKKAVSDHCNSLGVQLDSCSGQVKKGKQQGSPSYQVVARVHLLSQVALIAGTFQTTFPGSEEPWSVRLEAYPSQILPLSPLDIATPSSCKDNEDDDILQVTRSFLGQYARFSAVPLEVQHFDRPHKEWCRATLNTFIACDTLVKPYGEPSRRWYYVYDLNSHDLQELEEVSIPTPMRKRKPSREELLAELHEQRGLRKVLATTEERLMQMQRHNNNLVDDLARDTKHMIEISTAMDAMVEQNQSDAIIRCNARRLEQQEVDRVYGEFVDITTAILEANGKKDEIMSALRSPVISAERKAKLSDELKARKRRSRTFCVKLLCSNAATRKLCIEQLLLPLQSCLVCLCRLLLRPDSPRGSRQRRRRSDACVL